jgi:hypothetical protein
VSHVALTRGDSAQSASRMCSWGGNAWNLYIARGNLHEIFFQGGIAKLTNIAGGYWPINPSFNKVLEPIENIFGLMLSSHRYQTRCIKSLKLDAIRHEFVSGENPHLTR